VGDAVGVGFHGVLLGWGFLLGSRWRNWLQSSDMKLRWWPTLDILYIRKI